MWLALFGRSLSRASSLASPGVNRMVMLLALFFWYLADARFCASVWAMPRSLHPRRSKIRTGRRLLRGGPGLSGGWPCGFS